MRAGRSIAMYGVLCATAFIIHLILNWSGLPGISFFFISAAAAAGMAAMIILFYLKSMKGTLFFNVVLMVLATFLFVELGSLAMISFHQERELIIRRFERLEDLPGSSYYITDENLGYRGMPHAAIKQSYEGKHNVTYSLGSLGWRVSPVTDSNRTLVLFGCSFAFGEAVSDNETLAYYLSESTGLQVNNLAFRGYGPQHMLAQLQDPGNAESLMSDAAVYYFMDGHIRRAIGDMHVYNSWGSSMPHYVLDHDGTLVRRGSFDEGRPVISWLYDMLGDLYFVKMGNVNLPPPAESHIILTVKIIGESSKIYEQQYGNEFYVFLLPEDSYMVPYLDEINVSYIIGKEGLTEGFTAPYTLHPNSELNRVSAEAISETIMPILLGN
jgi:hypothetical protein